MFLLYRPMCELWPTNRLRFMSLRESVITKSAGFCSPTVGHSRQSASDRPGLGLRRRSFLRMSTPGRRWEPRLSIWPADTGSSKQLGF